MRALGRLYEFIPKYWMRGLIALFSLLVGTVITLAIPYIVKLVIDGPLATGNIAEINGYVLVILGAAFVRGIAALVQTYSTESLAESVVYDLRNKLYQHLQRLSFGYYDKIMTGELMSRLTSDVETLRMALGWGLINSAANVITLSLIVMMLFSLNWKLALIANAVLPLAILTVMRYNQKSRPAFQTLQAQIARMTSFLQENISGIRVVKAFGQEDAEHRRFKVLNDENLARSLGSNKILAFYFPLITLISGVGAAIVLGVGGSRVAVGQISLGTLVAFNTYLAMLAGPIRVFGRVMGILTRAAASTDRIFEVLDAKPDIIDLPDAAVLKDCRGEVYFDNVSFGYLPGREVLSGITFKAEPGSLIAVVGPTGSGKTSLINLIPRFYDPTSGVVKVDGLNASHYSFHSLRQNVGFVMQDTFLFSAGIRENIAFGRPDISLDQVKDGARLAAIDGFIESLPEGYDAIIGERGIGLSGGQKQRLALARALVLHPPILLMDDALSSVDTETEQLIIKHLEMLRGKCTIIFSAQRFSLVRNADCILVLEHGKLVECGTHQELIASSGLYNKMYQMQLE